MQQLEPGLRLLEPRMSKTLDETVGITVSSFRWLARITRLDLVYSTETCIKQSRFDGQTSEAPPVDWTYNCWSETRSWYSREPSETTRYSLFNSLSARLTSDYTACLNPDLVFSKLNVQWNYPYIKHLTTSEFVLSVVVYSLSKNKPMSVFLDYYPWSKIHEMVKAFVRIPTGQRQFK